MAYPRQQLELSGGYDRFNPVGEFFGGVERGVEYGVRHFGHAASEIGQGIVGTVEHVTHPAFAWCGWWMKHHLGINIPGLNLDKASNWQYVGSPASGPCVGCLGVKAHHVYQVVRVIDSTHVLAISGNDGHAVRTRVRSTSGTFAWRRV